MNAIGRKTNSREQKRDPKFDAMMTQWKKQYEDKQYAAMVANVATRAREEEVRSTLPPIAQQLYPQCCREIVTHFTRSGASLQRDWM